MNEIKKNYKKRKNKNKKKENEKHRNGCTKLNHRLANDINQRMSKKSNKY